MRTDARVVALATAATLTLTACTTVRSVRGDSEAPTLDDRSGVVYYLPRRLVRVTVKRTPVTIDAVAKDLVTKLTAAQAAEHALATTRFARERATNATPAARTTLLAAEQAAERAKRNADLAVADARRVLNVARGGGGLLKDTFQVDLLPPVPDTSRPFVAQLRHSPLRDDDVTIETTEDGLLKSVHSKATDRTMDIVVDVAKTIVQFARVGAAFDGVRVATTQDRRPPFELSRVLDPTREADTGAFNADLSRLSMEDYALLVAPLDTPAPPDTLADEQVVSGVFYRRALPYRIGLRRATGTQEVLTDKVVMLPNEGPLAALTFPSAAFTTAEFRTDFVNGMPVKRHAKQGSEIAGLFSVVPNALKEIASIPAEIFQVRIDQTGKGKQLLDAQLALLKSQQALLDAQQAVQPAPASGAATDGE